MSQALRVIIIEGGFGRRYAARALKPESVDVTLIDRPNHHLFRPLLYQIATGSLLPGHKEIVANRSASEMKGDRVGVAQ